jgi:hypothetical protein
LLHPLKGWSLHESRGASESEVNENISMPATDIDELTESDVVGAVHDEHPSRRKDPD